MEKDNKFTKEKIQDYVNTYLREHGILKQSVTTSIEEEKLQKEKVLNEDYIKFKKNVNISLLIAVSIFGILIIKKINKNE
jgi:hypothetical protein